MKKIFNAFALLTFVVIALTSCQSGSDIGKLVPNDAVMVSYFDSKSMLSKVSLEEIKNTQIYRNILSDSSLPQWSRALLENPEKSGIALDEGFLFFATSATDGTLGFAFSGKIKSEADFQKFNEEMDPSSRTEEQHGVKLFTVRNKGVAGWKKDRFVFAATMKNPIGEMDLGSDSTQLDSLESKLGETNINQTKAFVDKVLNLKSDQSLAKEKSLNELLKEKGDVKVWMNNERSFGLSSGVAALSMLKMDDLIKDSRTTYSVSFEDGEIRFNGKAYFGKELGSLVSKYNGDPLKTKDFTRIPSNDVVSVMAFNFNPEIIKALLQKLGMDGLANMFLSETGVTLDDITKAFDGHFLISVSDLKEPPATEDSLRAFKDYNNLPLNFMFSMGIKDPQSFDKLQKVLNSLFLGSEEDKINPAFRNNYFVIGNNKAFVDNYLDNKEPGKADWYKNLDGHTSVIHVDLKRILTWFAATEGEKSEYLEKSKSFWGVLDVNGTEVKSSSAGGTGKLTLQDSKTNSLKQIVHYMDDMYQINQKEEKERSEELDSLLAHPPMDTIGVENKVKDSEI